MSSISAQEVKEFYRLHNDDMHGTRYESDFAMRAYAHRTRNERLLALLEPGKTMLEVGAGDGVFAVMAAKKGLTVFATDISEPNIERARRYASEQGVGDKVRFVLADAAHIPASDASYDIVVASHVLEHVPDFNEALAEVYRVSRDKALIALPTCLSPCAWSLLGGCSWWYFGKKSIPAMIYGMLRVFWGLITGADWVDEGSYGGKEGAPHLWRFPWAMRRHLREGGFEVLGFEADSFPIPWINALAPVSKYLDRFRDTPVLRELGYGSHALLQKRNKK